ncbi:MAG: hypothetical protein WA220_10680 [Candidatus Nitrosopolaris sp.]
MTYPKTRVGKNNALNLIRLDPGEKLTVFVNLYAHSDTESVGPPWRTTDKSVNHQLKFLVHEYYRVRQVVLGFMQARQDHSYYDSDRVGLVQIKRINQTR